MKIAILSQHKASFSVQRLKQAGAALDHRVRVLNPQQFCVSITEGKPELYYQDKKLQLPDALIPRIGASITFFGTSVSPPVRADGRVLR